MASPAPQPKSTQRNLVRPGRSARRVLARTPVRLPPQNSLPQNELLEDEDDEDFFASQEEAEEEAAAEEEAQAQEQSETRDSSRAVLLSIQRQIRKEQDNLRKARGTSSDKKEFTYSLFLTTLILAMMVDAFDAVSTLVNGIIPGISLLFTVARWPLSGMLFIMLWNYTRTPKAQVVRGLSMLTEIIPFINIIPANMLFVIYIYLEQRIEAKISGDDASSEEAEKIEKKIRALRLQMQRIYSAS